MINLRVADKITFLAHPTSGQFCRWRKHARQAIKTASGLGQTGFDYASGVEKVDASFEKLVIVR